MLRTKYENWRELVEECRDSGKAATEWCREKDIPYGTYRCWLGRIQTDTDSGKKKREPKQQQWVCVDAGENVPGEGSLEISCGKIRIVAEKGFDAEALLRILQAVCPC